MSNNQTPEMKVVALLSGFVRELAEGADPSNAILKLAPKIIKAAQPEVCPKCENPHYHTHIDGSKSCDECDFKWNQKNQ